MKLAIIGYGKMGREIEKVALRRGHEVVCKIDIDSQADFDSDAFRSADVAVEFTNPGAARENIRRSWEQGVPVVSGSTGWINALTREWIKTECANGNKLVTSANFSLGMNAMMAANKIIARMLAPYSYYSVKLHEVHHVNKKDHPSGSAIALADGIIEENSRYTTWQEPQANSLHEGSIPVTYERLADAPGTHEVVWDSPMCTLSIHHEAKNRDGFAIGAVVAAEWLSKNTEPGHYSMEDVLQETYNI